MNQVKVQRDRVWVGSVNVQLKTLDRERTEGGLTHKTGAPVGKLTLLNSVSGRDEVGPQPQ